MLVTLTFCELSPLVMRHPWLLLPRLRFTPYLDCQPAVLISSQLSTTSVHQLLQAESSQLASPSDSLNDNVSFARSQVERHDPPTNASIMQAAVR